MALYLKYRPQNFDQIVGQDFIKTTLRNAIDQNKTVGAYIFTGPRGTGKTSTARIFAKALNCEHPQDGNPCGICEICKAFSENKLIDIIEIDAASHTGVDNIRDIIDKAQFRPTQTKYKVYIIDEVHMLSKGAFNALLKILEEPPEHVKFILATTDIHKVPDTILSRCQRYDFKNFSEQEVREQLEYIARNENIEMDEKSLEYIILQANGGMRNAISLFEQLIFDGKIAYEIIAKNLGIAENQEIDEMISFLLLKDIQALIFFQKLVKQGKNMKYFFLQVLENLTKQSIQNIEKNMDISSNIIVLKMLEAGLIRIKNTPDENLSFEIMILEILSGTSSELSVSLRKEKNIEQKGEEGKSHEEKKIYVQDPEQTVKIEQVENIFGGDASKNIPGENLDIGEKKFESEKFILTCKNLGAKAALTLTLKGCILKYNSGILEITAKTKIALSTLEKPENREILLNGLKELGYENLELRILSC